MEKAVEPDGGPGVVPRRIICTGETYKDKVKLTFAKGASLNEGDEIDESAFKSLVRAAAALNASKARG
jgi:hypothetical protein